ncbi:MAG TPA: hypothetical protein PLF40_17000, partial [Kofleriaceae bacterium]|nr:hypothetical protein [Kofleriaceae bacterium]
KMDGPLDDRRGFAIQSLNTMTNQHTATNPRHGNQPTPRQPTHAAATNPRHGNQPTPRQPTHATATNPRAHELARLPPHILPNHNGARRHESSFAPTGGAAQLFVPQRARGCAANSRACVRSANPRPR